MKTHEGYNKWSGTYDAVENKTRDLELQAQQSLLENYNWDTCLELGCGTGKNTAWLSARSTQLTAVDFNELMMDQAKTKVNLPHITFIHTDIQQKWDFLRQPVDLISCSLILEHIENLSFIFGEASTHLNEGGLFYIGELHPFKQYLGSKAKFETEKGTTIIEQFTHHFSQYITCAQTAGFQVLHVDEFFDAEDKMNQSPLPRILAFVLKKEMLPQQK